MSSTTPAAGRPVIDGWFTEGAEPALIGRRCPDCHTVAFPPTERPCPNPTCLAQEMEPYELARTGTIWSYTDAQYQPPPPYIPRTDPYEPFAIAAVEVDRDALVVLGQVADGYGVADLQVGMRVELTVEPLHQDGDEAVLTWKWRPIAQSTNEEGDA